ncbi:secretion protein [Chitinimonas arctica]|uniref:Secretion protein n=1 Tax=Chitinimonas arctica TaxID=2594795 RepID=A0A516SM22_9NEIS|nr:secretion protein [Chitinimonas arctica]
MLAEQPQNAAAQALQRQIEEKKRRGSDSGLADAFKKPITLQFKDASLRTVFDIIARTSGLNFLFDKDVRTEQKTSIFLKNSSIEAAINLTLLTNQLEQRVLDGNTILIYPDTQAKRKDYQPMLVRTFYLANAEAKTVANTLKTIVKSKDVVVDDKLNMIILRDSPEVVRQAEKLVALHDLPEPEVMLEVEVLEVKRGRLLELGVNWPNQLGLAPLQAAGSSLTLSDLRGLNSRRISATVGSVGVNAKNEDSDANLLANPRIRTHNREKAKILIGSRVPVITSTLTTGFSSESVAYVDVGLKLDVEPTIYPDDEISIKTSLEVSSILKTVETKTTRAYEIGTRTASTVLRLRDGENQVLAGLISNEDRRTTDQVPLLGDIPLLGRLFGSQLNDHTKTEIVLSITPRLIRNIRRPDADILEFDSGTDSNFRRSRLDTGAKAGSGGALLKQTSGSPPAVATPTPTPAAVAAPILPATVPAEAAKATTPAPATPNGKMQWDGPDRASVGQTIELQVVYQGETALNGMPVSLSYDPRVLEIIKVSEGDFFKHSGSTAFSSDIEAGRISINNLLSSATGAKGGGVVATLTARILSAEGGQTLLKVNSAAPQAIDGRSLDPALSDHTLKLEP